MDQEDVKSFGNQAILPGLPPVLDQIRTVNIIY